MYYIIFFLILFLLINTYFKIAERFNIIDKPNVRSSHSVITIRGGGIIFITGALVYFIFSDFKFPWFIAGLLLISFISLMDDIKTISSSLRIMFQFVAVLLLFYQLNLFSFSWFIWIMTLVITIGIINAYNFMDGINGITGGYSLAVLAGLWMANNYNFFFIDNQFIYFTGMALLVFNVYNFRKKARCFAGDVGSVSIAFILIFLFGKLIFGSGNMVYLFFLALYGIDSVLTIIHRIYLKENIFKPHRKHFYQVLANEAKIPHTNISAGYTLLQTLLNLLIVVLVTSFSTASQWIVLFLLVALLSFIYVLIKKKYYSFTDTIVVTKDILL
jgi:UDP-GlcNAc:undecaprenyl-phosphate GlcNAc-1-phosphate transferase